MQYTIYISDKAKVKALQTLGFDLQELKNPFRVGDTITCIESLKDGYGDYVCEKGNDHTVNKIDGDYIITGHGDGVHFSHFVRK